MSLIYRVTKNEFALQNEDIHQFDCKVKNTNLQYPMEDEACVSG